MAKTKLTPDDVPGPEHAKTKIGDVDPGDDTEGHAHTKTGFTDQPGPSEQHTATGYVQLTDDDTEGHVALKQ